MISELNNQKAALQNAGIQNIVMEVSKLCIQNQRQKRENHYKSMLPTIMQKELPSLFN